MLTMIVVVYPKNDTSDSVAKCWRNGEHNERYQMQPTNSRHTIINTKSYVSSDQYRRRNHRLLRCTFWIIIIFYSLYNCWWALFALLLRIDITHGIYSCYVPCVVVVLVPTNVCMNVFVLVVSLLFSCYAYGCYKISSIRTTIHQYTHTTSTHSTHTDTDTQSCRA